MRTSDECPACGATSPRGDEAEDLYHKLEAAEARERALRERLERVMYRCKCFPTGTRQMDWSAAREICDECKADRALLREAANPVVKNEATAQAEPRKPWRVGRKVGRTVYEGAGDDGKLIGVMDTRELAALVVESVNRAMGSAAKTATAEPCTCSLLGDCPMHRSMAKAKTTVCPVCEGPPCDGSGPHEEGAPCCECCPIKVPMAHIETTEPKR
jgi:hypothetical protein